MAYDFQVTVDCTEPHALADWWAETLGWEVEPSNEDFIRSMVAQGFATEAETTTHKGVLVWATGQAILHPDSPEGMLRRRVLFQTVPEGKSVKNRLHLDLRVGADNVEAVLAGVVARGGRELHRGQQGPQSWVTVADPQGNEFCIG